MCSSQIKDFAMEKQVVNLLSHENKQNDISVKDMIMKIAVPVAYYAMEQYRTNNPDVVELLINYVVGCLLFFCQEKSGEAEDFFKSVDDLLDTYFCYEYTDIDVCDDKIQEINMECVSNDVQQMLATMPEDDRKMLEAMISFLYILKPAGIDYFFDEVLGLFISGPLTNDKLQQIYTDTIHQMIVDNDHERNNKMEVQNVL